MPEFIEEKETEFVVGKAVVSDIGTLNKVVEHILSRNIDLRHIKYRHLVKVLAEDILKRKVSDESIPRSCRHVQNTLGKFKPDKDDKRFELEEKYNEAYGGF